MMPWSKHPRCVLCATGKWHLRHRLREMPPGHAVQPFVPQPLSTAVPYRSSPYSRTDTYLTADDPLNPFSPTSPLHMVTEGLTTSWETDSSSGSFDNTPDSSSNSDSSDFAGGGGGFGGGGASGDW